MKYAILKSNKLISLTKPILISFCFLSVNSGNEQKEQLSHPKKCILNDFIDRIRQQTHVRHNNC